MEKKERDRLMLLFMSSVLHEKGALNVRRLTPNYGEFGIYSRQDGKFDKNLCRAAACRHLHETPEEFVSSLAGEGVYDPRFARIALQMHDRLRRLCGLSNEVVQAAQFACSPEGRKHGSGAMHDLRQAVQAYTEAQASE